MKDKIHIRKEHFKLSGDYAGKLIRLGVPAGFSQAIMAMASIVVQSLTNSFGTAVIAANVIVMRIDGYVMMPNFSFGIAMTTFTGQNLGARKFDRIHQGVGVGTRLAGCVSGILSAILFLFGKQIAFAFTDVESTAAMVGTFLRIMAIGYVAVAVNQALTGVIRGAGDTVSPMWISMLTTILIRVPLAYMIAFLTRSEANPAGNYRALPISIVCAWTLGMLITVAVFYKGKWRRTIDAARDGQSAQA